MNESFNKKEAYSEETVDTAVNEFGHGSLHKAVIHNRVDVFSNLLCIGHDVNKQDELGFSPLHLAALLGRKEIIKLFLQLRISKQEIDACSLKNEIEENAFLTSKKSMFRDVDVNARTKNGQTALHLAVKNGHSDCLELLLKLGCDCNVPDQKGKALFHFAKTSNQKLCSKILEEEFLKKNNLSDNEEGKSQENHLLMERTERAFVSVDLSKLDHDSDHHASKNEGPINSEDDKLIMSNENGSKIHDEDVPRLDGKPPEDTARAHIAPGISLNGSRIAAFDTGKNCISSSPDSSEAFVQDSTREHVQNITYPLHCERSFIHKPRTFDEIFCADCLLKRRIDRSVENRESRLIMGANQSAEGDAPANELWEVWELNNNLNDGKKEWNSPNRSRKTVQQNLKFAPFTSRSLPCVWRVESKECLLVSESFESVSRTRDYEDGKITTKRQFTSLPDLTSYKTDKGFDETYPQDNSDNNNDSSETDVTNHKLGALYSPRSFDEFWPDQTSTPEKKITSDANTMSDLYFEGSAASSPLGVRRNPNSYSCDLSSELITYSMSHSLSPIRSKPDLPYIFCEDIYHIRSDSDLRGKYGRKNRNRQDAEDMLSRSTSYLSQCFLEEQIDYFPCKDDSCLSAQKHKCYDWSLSLEPPYECDKNHLTVSMKSRGDDSDVEPAYSYICSKDEDLEGSFVCSDCGVTIPQMGLNENHSVSELYRDMNNKDEFVLICLPEIDDNSSKENMLETKKKIDNGLLAGAMCIYPREESSRNRRLSGVHGSLENIEEIEAEIEKDSAVIEEADNESLELKSECTSMPCCNPSLELLCHISESCENEDSGEKRNGCVLEEANVSGDNSDKIKFLENRKELPGNCGRISEVNGDECSVECCGIDGDIGCYRMQENDCLNRRDEKEYRNQGKCSEIDNCENTERRGRKKDEAGIFRVCGSGNCDLKRDRHVDGTRFCADDDEYFDKGKELGEGQRDEDAEAFRMPDRENDDETLNEKGDDFHKMKKFIDCDNRQVKEILIKQKGDFNADDNSSQNADKLEMDCILRGSSERIDERREDAIDHAIESKLEAVKEQRNVINTFEAVMEPNKEIFAVQTDAGKNENNVIVTTGKGKSEVIASGIASKDPSKGMSEVIIAGKQCQEIKKAEKQLSLEIRMTETEQRKELEAAKEQSITDAVRLVGRFAIIGTNLRFSTDSHNHITDCRSSENNLPQREYMCQASDHCQDFHRTEEDENSDDYVTALPIVEHEDGLMFATICPLDKVTETSLEKFSRSPNNSGIRKQSATKRWTFAASSNWIDEMKQSQIDNKEVESSTKEHEICNQHASRQHYHRRSSQLYSIENQDDTAYGCLQCTHERGISQSTNESLISADTGIEIDDMSLTDWEEFNVDFMQSSENNILTEIRPTKVISKKLFSENVHETDFRLVKDKKDSQGSISNCEWTKLLAPVVVRSSFKTMERTEESIETLQKKSGNIEGDALKLHNDFADIFSKMEDVTLDSRCLVNIDPCLSDGIAKSPLTESYEDVGAAATCAEMLSIGSGSASSRNKVKRATIQKSGSQINALDFRNFDSNANEVAQNCTDVNVDELSGERLTTVNCFSESESETIGESLSQCEGEAMKDNSLRRCFIDQFEKLISENEEERVVIEELNDAGVNRLRIFILNLKFEDNGRNSSKLKVTDSDDTNYREHCQRNSCIELVTKRRTSEKLNGNLKNEADQGIHCYNHWNDVVSVDLSECWIMKDAKTFAFVFIKVSESCMSEKMKAKVADSLFHLVIKRSTCSFTSVINWILVFLGLLKNEKLVYKCHKISQVLTLLTKLIKHAYFISTYTRQLAFILSRPHDILLRHFESRKKFLLTCIKMEIKEIAFSCKYAFRIFVIVHGYLCNLNDDFKTAFETVDGHLSKFLHHGNCMDFVSDILVYLGLLKSEFPVNVVADLETCLAILTHIVEQAYFSSKGAMVLHAFIAKPNKLLNTHRPEILKLQSALEGKMDEKEA